MVAACGTRAPADLDSEQSTVTEGGSESDVDSDSDTDSDGDADSDSDGDSDETDIRDQTDSDADESPGADTETRLDTNEADAGSTDTGDEIETDSGASTDSATDNATETATDSSVDLDAGLDPACGNGTNSLCDAGMDGGLLAAVDGYTGPRSIVLFIGDGMGYSHVAATSLYKTGAAGALFFESFPVHGEVETYSANSTVTDSAAAATAMATGRKVDNYTIARIGTEDLPSLLDFHHALGKSTGLVTTDILTHATPAAFAAHADSRYDYDEIARHYLTTGRPTVLFGGGGDGLTAESAEQAGYQVVTSRTELIALDTEGLPMVCGLFGSGHIPYTFDESDADLPDLSEMASRAVDILSEDPDGYFLMVEGARIDHASHANDIYRAIYEVWELESTIEALTMTSFEKDDTLFVVTADHETGGLVIIEGRGAGNLPDGMWSTSSHTGVNVPVYATGKWSERFDGVIDNTDIFTFLTASTL